ncbi:hypothetical protein EVAR_9159_1 [Eumeta japonica]|uniref:Uncharacterized protein n=1 Tax=Eumeta variegata TaxID=151549 RepID=A0A4C1TW77_EUMVA|nr:hypothetical protein EVAR_9159_1 [Eumeta japonica]
MITEILYAKDLSFLTESSKELQRPMSHSPQTCFKIDLKININKTEVMCLNIHDHEAQPIRLGKDVLKLVDKSCCLTNTLTSKYDFNNTTGLLLNSHRLLASLTKPYDMR